MWKNRCKITWPVLYLILYFFFGYFLNFDTKELVRQGIDVNKNLQYSFLMEAPSKESVRNI